MNNTYDIVLPLELDVICDGISLWQTLLLHAEIYFQGDEQQKVQAAREAMHLIGGTAGQRVVLWGDLREAVGQWHEWDTNRDKQGDADWADLPSRERVDFDVWVALTVITRHIDRRIVL